MTPATRGVALGVAAMAVIVVASNILVQYPINEWLTWGALTYPVSFLINDLVNRAFGPKAARRVVYAGFALAVVLSIALATPRIAVASGTAFLVAQLLDIQIFDRLRRHAWWTPPLVSSLIGSVVDTLLFFSIAFAGMAEVVVLGIGGVEAVVPIWVTWALGDFAVKVAMTLVMLLPFRLAVLATLGAGPKPGLGDANGSPR